MTDHNIFSLNVPVRKTKPLTAFSHTNKQKGVNKNAACLSKLLFLPLLLFCDVDVLLETVREARVFKGDTLYNEQ